MVLIKRWMKLSMKSWMGMNVLWPYLEELNQTKHLQEALTAVIWVWLHFAH